VKHAGDEAYLVLSPVGPSGIAIIGDTDHFVTMGRKRVTELTDDGTVRLTIAFANGETTRTITGYSRNPVAVEGASGPVSYDEATRLFRVPVSPGVDGWS
jgi:hypothetical protein